MEYRIDNEEDLNEFNLAIKNKELDIKSFNSANILTIEVNNKVSTLVCNPELAPSIDFNLEEITKLIQGKNPLERIVNISYKENNIHIFIERCGSVYESVIPYKHWTLGTLPTSNSYRLKGNTYFKFIRYYNDEDDFQQNRKLIYQYKLFNVKNIPEAFMVLNGYTYFKGMTPEDVSTLSFDIETSGINPQAKDAKVFLITNTLRKGKELVRKTFNLKEYNNNDSEMISDWCDWVREVNPTILLGHNIIMFDLPYLDTRAEKGLCLGRDNSVMTTEPYTRELRKDGSQSYSYSRKTIFGREVIDTFFLAIKYDIARKYQSYGLKSLIKEEKLEKIDRTFIDASKIREYYRDDSMWEKVVKYGEEDSDDALKLYDLMIPSIFYSNQMIPKTFQVMLESASGSQLNSLMLRSYLQDGYTISKASDPVQFEGAISMGITGVYRNCVRFDVASLYPSIIIQFSVENKQKDFNGNFLKIIKYLRDERLKNKALSKKTNNRFYDDLQNAQKVLINSMYGFLGSQGSNYNHPEGAAEITRHGREILKSAIKLLTSKNYEEFLVEKEQGVLNVL